MSTTRPTDDLVPEVVNMAGTIDPSAADSDEGPEPDADEQVSSALVNAAVPPGEEGAGSEAEVVVNAGRTRSTFTYASDTGFADLIAGEFKGTIRYCPDEKVWLTFTSKNGWLRDSTNLVTDLVSGLAKRMRIKALEKAKSMMEIDGNALIKAATDLGNSRRIANALTIAQCKRHVVVRAVDLDSDPSFVGTENGVVNLRTGDFFPHSKNQLVTRRLACEFDADATCPEWDKFMERVQPDPETRSFIQRLLGYSMTGENRDHILPHHLGTGANGKSTGLEQVFLRLMGSYGTKITPALIYASDRAPSPDLEKASLCGRRFALGEENPSGGRLNEAWLKAATGGDSQRGRFHYGNFFDYLPTAKIALVGNHQLEIDSVDVGLWRRFLLVNWPVQIPEGERDTELPAKLASELSGILNWCIEGAVQWYAGGLRAPAQTKKDTADFKSASDKFADFTTGFFGDDPGGWVTVANCYLAYQEWATSEGQRKQLTKRMLSTELSSRGWEQGTVPGPTRARAWIGKRLLKPVLEPDICSSVPN